MFKNTENFFLLFIAISVILLLRNFSELFFFYKTDLALKSSWQFPACNWCLRAISRSMGKSLVPWSRKWRNAGCDERCVTQHSWLDEIRFNHKHSRVQCLPTWLLSTKTW